MSADRRREATQAIAARYKSLKGRLNHRIVPALAKDSSKESSELLRTLSYEQNGPSREAFQELMKRGDPHAAETLGKLLQNPLFRHNALTAVSNTNERGEEVVLQFLAKSQDDSLNWEVCHALAESGSKKSVPQLQQILERAQQKNDQRLKIAAERALKQISERN